MKNLLIFLLFIQSHVLFAQLVGFSLVDSIPIQLNNTPLTQAWVGGFNAPQFQKMDLNGDKVEDLVVFDRTASKLFTFSAVKSGKTWRWHYTPAYEHFFPVMRGWMVLRDYDADGRKDIFTHASGGIRVFRNVTEPNQPPRWKLSTDELSTEGLSSQVNLQVAITDIPHIADLDGDGDIDILIYEFAQGSYLEFHANQSQERTGKADQLLFKRQGFCWGGIGEGQNCGEIYFDRDCDLHKKGSGGGEILENPAEIKRITHAGSSLTVADLNGDKQCDLLVGDVSCPNIYAIFNEGTNQKPHFTRFDTLFPRSRPITMSIFPATFLADVNFDAKPDLLASPNVFINEANQVDFQHSAWLYLNKGKAKKPNFQFQQTDFLQNEMLDLGENAFPTFADADADGDLDMWIGNRGTLKTGVFSATIHFFRNIGTAHKPAFQLITADFASLSEQKWTDIKPFFLDLDEDGKLDLAFTAQRGRDIKVFFLKNPFTDTPTLLEYPIRLDSRDFPCFTDVDADGDLDALIGKGTGELVLLRNKGTTAQPDFQAENPYPNLRNDPTHRDLTPFVADLNGDKKPDLITGDSSGYLTVYHNFLEEGLSDKQTEMVFNTLAQQYTRYKFGADVFPVAVDWNADGIADLVIGTNTGGVRFLRNRASEE